MLLAVALIAAFAYPTAAASATTSSASASDAALRAFGYGNVTGRGRRYNIGCRGGKTRVR